MDFNYLLFIQKKVAGQIGGVMVFNAMAILFKETIQ
jgi:hypothetical protein